MDSLYVTLFPKLSFNNMKNDVVCAQVAKEMPNPKAREAEAQNAAGNTDRGKGEPLTFLELLKKLEDGIAEKETLLYAHCKHK